MTRTRLDAVEGDFEHHLGLYLVEGAVPPDDAGEEPVGKVGDLGVREAGVRLSKDAKLAGGGL